MKLNVLLTAALLAVLSGCAAQVAEDENTVATGASAVTLAECATQRDACFAQYPLFGLLTCPLQYNQCVLTADNGIPAQVTAAIADAAACADEARTCRQSAESAADLLICTEGAALCVGSIVGVDLPNVVEGTLACVDGAVECITASESLNDLAGCGETLTQCAVDEAVSLLPPAVTEIVEDVLTCEQELATCTLSASAPSELAACAEANVACVAGSLNVDLPVPPVSDALECAESAASCALASESLSDLGGCGDDLIACAASLVQEQLTCEQQWTACLNANPFNFFGCAAEFATCRD